MAEGNEDRQRAPQSIDERKHVNAHPKIFW
jgi:hypothetical protein